MTRPISPAVFAIIRWSESCRLAAYCNPGDVPTIGWGHTGPGVHPGLACSQAQADAWLQADVAAAAAAVDRLVTVPLTDNQRSALACWTFALGEGHLARSTLLAKLNAGETAAVPAEMARWDLFAGHPVPRIAERRRREAALWSTPDGADA